MTVAKVPPADGEELALARRPDLLPMGEAALLWRWPARVPSPRMSATVGAAWRAVRAGRLGGVVDTVPGPASLLVRFDPLRTTAEAVRLAVEALLPADADPAPGRTHTLAVRYGGADGPDLDEVAGRLGMRPEAVIRAHQQAHYSVLVTGFMPGFVYLGPLAPSLRLPRREYPRRVVPAGSVAIAEAQTGVYGVQSAGGWWLIGRVEARLFDPRANPPTRFAIGDQVSFQPADHIGM
jgi:KipI family sensor histidine kinase inhibitor